MWRRKLYDDGDGDDDNDYDYCDDDENQLKEVDFLNWNDNMKSTLRITIYQSWCW